MGFLRDPVSPPRNQKIVQDMGLISTFDTQSATEKRGVYVCKNPLLKTPFSWLLTFPLFSGSFFTPWIGISQKGSLVRCRFRFFPVSSFFFVFLLSFSSVFSVSIFSFFSLFAVFVGFLFFRTFYIFFRFLSVSFRFISTGETPFTRPLLRNPDWRASSRAAKRWGFKRGGFPI